MSDSEQWGVDLYEPITPTPEHPDYNDCFGFHQSKAQIRIIIGANRSSKTESMLADLAALAKGPPFPSWFNWDGNPEPPLTIWLVLNQFPKNPRADARLKKLYFGERKIIDGEWKWCPPFIPHSAIKANPDGNYLNVTIENDTVIIVKSSKQSDLAMASDNVDLIAIDEPTEDDKWDEFVARMITSPVSRLIHALTDAWLTTDYLDHILDEDSKEDLDVDVFHFTTGGNPHVDQTRASKTFKLQTRETRLVREMGMRRKTTLLCYPKVFRWLDERTGREIKNPLSPVGTGNFIRPFKIPREWTRYVVHDPGIKVAATMWFAVEPETQNIFGYRCCYMRAPGSNIEMIVETINQANQGDEVYCWFIDPKAAKHTPRNYIYASEEATIDVYRRCSEPFDIRWVPGPPKLESMHRKTRVELLTAYLDPQAERTPMMLFFDEEDAVDPARGIVGMSGLKSDFKRYMKDPKTGIPIRGHDDSVYCCEAAAAMRLRWRGSPAPDGGWQRILPTRDPVAEFMNGSRVENWREEP